MKKISVEISDELEGNIQELADEKYDGDFNKVCVEAIKDFVMWENNE